MSFTETPAAAFTAGVSTISAATANTWKANIADSLDTVNGGAYVNVATIDWSAGSAGWRFYAAVAIKSTGTLTLDAGATVTINADPSLFGTMRVGVGGAGGGVRFYATSTLQVDDTVAVSIAGDVTMTGASTETHASGSTDTYPTGSTFTIQSGSIANLNLGGVSAAGVTFIGANGAAVWNGASTATWQTASISSWESGATWTVASGVVANATFGGGGTAGTLAVGATGTFTVTAGAAVTMSVGGGGTAGSVTFNANGTLTTSASSVFSQGGTTTRTGVEILSGTGAYTRLRRVTGLAADSNVVGTDQDFLIVPGNGAALITYTLQDVGATDVVSFVLKYTSLGFGLVIKNSAALTVFTFSNAGGTSKSVQFFTDGTGVDQWTVGIIGADS